MPGEPVDRLEAVRQAARKDRTTRFTALLHHVTPERLAASFFALRRQAAPGIDGVTWDEYARGLYERIADLHARVHRGSYRAKPSKRAWIATSDGRQRPLGIAALEDKIVQHAVKAVLEAIFERVNVASAARRLCTLTRFDRIVTSRVHSSNTITRLRHRFVSRSRGAAERTMKGQGQKLGLLLLAGDLVVAAASWLSAYAGRFLLEISPPAPHGVPPLDWCLRGLPLILLLTLVSCRVAGLYDLNRLRRLSHELSGIARANAVLVLLLIAVMFYRKDPYKSRLVVAMFLALNVAGMAVARRAAWWVIHSLRRSGFNPSPALIVGSGRVAQKLAAVLRANGWTGLEPVGFVDDQPGREVSGLPVIGELNDLESVVARERVAYVFVALPLERYASVQPMMKQLADLPVDVRLVPDVPNLAAMSLNNSELGGLPIIGLRRDPHDGLSRLVKRAMDVLIASAGLVVMSPLFAVIAAIIKITSRGPVFYRQERASLAGTPFLMLKFRTMRVDAEQATGPVWTTENDPRRTRLGTLLRRTSIDELPQLWNVLRGDMSIVGPRPERPVFIDKFRRTVPHYMLRHSVKAGITGWAQVHGWRGNTSLRKRVQYDLHYIAHWTPWLDLRIMFLTLVRGMIGRSSMTGNAY